MDSKEFRAILSRSGVGIWALIEAAIGVASSEYGEELRSRRDGIVQSLYTPAAQLCNNCSGGVGQDHRFHNRDSKTDYSSEDVDHKDNNYDSDKNLNVDDDESKRNLNVDVSKSPLTPESNHRNLSGSEDEEDLDPYGGLFDDDEQTKIISIKEQLEDPHQSEEAVVELLQSLSDMDINFQALKETDIGRHVNRLRKNPSNEVRRLVKQLVRKWKETVDEWVKVNQPQATANLIADVDSPQQNIPKIQQNGHHQVPDFGYSPNPRNGGSTSERNSVEHETNRKAPQSSARREAPSRPPQSVPKPASTPPPNRARESAVDDERLNSARKRLQENYQEANNGLIFSTLTSIVIVVVVVVVAVSPSSNYTYQLLFVCYAFSLCEAKRQRTIQVMDIHEIPKPKNTFFARNKGGFQGRHQR